MRDPARGYDYGDTVIAAVPIAHAVGLVVWWAFEVRMHLAVSGASLLAAGAIAEALFVKPPTG